MKLLLKLDFFWSRFIFLCGKHFISLPVWLTEASVISSAPTVPDKSGAMLDWKDRRAIFQMDPFSKNISWHNHVFSLKAQGRPVFQIAVVSWLPGLNRNRSCVLIEPRGTLKPHPFCFTLSARRLKSGKHYRRVDNCPRVSSRQKATLRQFPLQIVKRGSRILQGCSKL